MPSGQRHRTGNGYAPHDADVQRLLSENEEVLRDLAASDLPIAWIAERLLELGKFD